MDSNKLLFTAEELDALLADVRGAEREACAQVAEKEIEKVKPLYSVTAENIVKAIRARGQQ